MAFTVLVEQVNKGKEKLIGDLFIRPHLRKLSPCQSILPFKVLSTRLGRKHEYIIKLGVNENPYGPPPEVMEALGALKFPYTSPDPQKWSIACCPCQRDGHILNLIIFLWGSVQMR